MSKTRLPRSDDDARTLDLTGANTSDADNRNRTSQAGNRGSRRASSRRGKTKARASKSGALWRFSVWNALFLGVLWIIERFIAEHSAPTTFITYIPQHGFGIASLALLLWAAWRKEKNSFSLNIVSLAFFVLTFLGFNVPWRNLSASMSTSPGTHAAVRANESSEISLRVMSYNVLRGQKGIKNLIATIREARPDVVCLQESDAWGGLGPIPSVEIARSLAGWHLARQGELAVVSRFPIVGSRAYAIRGSTGTQKVVLKLGAREVTVFNTHFVVRIGADLPSRTISMKPRAASRRQQQLNNLLQAIETTNAPFIIAGDFNTPPRGLFYRALASRLGNAWQQAGRGAGYSFPSRLPLLRIDHIWMSQKVRATRCFVPPSRASDHCPVVADLKINFE